MSVASVRKTGLSAARKLFTHTAVIMALLLGVLGICCTGIRHD